MWPSPVTTYLVLVSSVRPIGPARVQLLRADADLGPEPELAPIGEPGRCVHHDGGGVDLGHEGAGRRLVFGDDGLGVTGRPPSDVGDGVVDRVDHPRGDVERVVLSGPVFVGDVGTRDAAGFGVGSHPWVGMNRDAGIPQRGQGRRQELVGDIGVHQEGLGSVADARALGLGVDQQRHRLVDIGSTIDVDVTVADTRLDHRDCRLLDHRADQARAAPRNQHVDQPTRCHQVLGGFMSRAWDQLDAVARQTGRLEGVLHDGDQRRVRFVRR